MSWNPPPEGAGGWTGDPGQQPPGPGYIPPPPGQQPPPPGYIPPPPPGQPYDQPGPYGQPGPPGQPYGQPGPPGQPYGQPPGPGVPSPQWYGVPGPGGYQPPRRRRTLGRNLGIGGAVVIVLIIVGSVLAAVHGNHTWKLTTPSTAAGLHRDTDSLDTLGLSTGVSSARSAITQVPGYGTVNSSVSAAYKKGSGPLVWFVGFNGSFKKQIVLKRYQGAKVVSVNAGPHGGAAECARSTSATLCQWSTGTTVADMIIRTSVLGGPVSVSSADSLMIKMRDSVEKSK